MFRGGKTGPVTGAGKSAQSRLNGAVTGTNGAPSMPPKSDPLAKKEIAILRNWIDAGAKAPAEEAPEKPIAQRHWAFQPIKRPDEPAVKNTGWCRNAIDRFIFHRVEKEGHGPPRKPDPLTPTRRL